jgi:predicted ATPase
MPIEQLRISNFKGIAEESVFDFRPITLFIGTNSSGKSSALHALISLAQTLKLGNTAPVLVLDEDFAHVHLGRFVEIAHSHSYTHPISIGVAVGQHSFSIGSKKSTFHIELEGVVAAAYEFKSTLRTQDVYVDVARLAIGERQIVVRRGTKAPYPYHLTEGNDAVQLCSSQINAAL